MAWWVVVGPLLALALLFVAVSLVVYSAQRAGDHGVLDKARWRRWASARVWVSTLLLGWLFVALVLPATIFGLAQAGLRNQPAQPVASALSDLGFTTPDLCESAGRTRVANAYEEASAQAKLNPTRVRTVEAGACGHSVPVSARFPLAPGSEMPEAERTALFESAAAVSSTQGSSFITKLTAFTALLSAAGVAVRRAGNGSEAAQTGWRARVRRILLAWLPLGLAAALLTWFFLARVFAVAVEPDRLAALAPALLPLAGLLIATWTDANITSVHTFYRQRLSSAFAVGRSEEGRADELPYEHVFRFSELRDVPLHVVTTANVRAYDEVPTRRGGLPLVLSTDGVRMATADGVIGVPMEEYELAAGAGQISVMAAVANSGAAVSPMAGRFAATVAPFRILLTVFNFRVGSWVHNPAWQESHVEPTHRTFWGIVRNWPAAFWLIARPGAAQVLVEAMGQSSVQDRWLYLSDGGHLDNTGLVEAVRMHRTGETKYAGRILVVDASNDALGTWSAIGDALAVVRAEFGVELACETGAPTKVHDELAEEKPGPWRDLAREVFRDWVQAPDEPVAMQTFMRLYRGRAPSDHLEIMVVKAVRPDLTGVLPDSVRSFALAHERFPRASTTRQDFGDLEFEAYRALGQFYTDEALNVWIRRIENQD